MVTGCCLWQEVEAGWAGHRVIDGAEGVIRAQAHIAHQVHVLGQDVAHLAAGEAAHAL